MENINKQTLIKIFVWLRETQSPSLDMIRIHKISKDHRIVKFTSYWSDDSSDSTYCIDTSRIITEGKIKYEDNFIFYLTEDPTKKC